MPIELVVFDMAGTTIHDPGAVAHSFEAALAAASVPVQRDRVTEVMGLPKRAAVHRLVAGTPAEHFVDAIHADFVQRMRHFYENDPDVREIRGAASVFRTLNLKGVRVALNTGF
jgi:phosphoglycolate phosphatase-like HAD superfamily hydrolase